MRDEGLRFVDLAEALRALPPERARRCFIPEGRPGAGPYGAQGNAWVAEQLAKRLDPPTVDPALDSGAAPGSPTASSLLARVPTRDAWGTP